MSRRAACFFLLPCLLGLLLLTAWPLLASGILSFTDSRGGISRSEARWVGLSNYREALQWPVAGESAPPGFAERPTSSRPVRTDDDRFARSTRNSLVFATMAVPFEVALALAAAMLLQRKFRGDRVVLAWLFLPGLIGGVAALYAWMSLLSPRFGLVNSAIHAVYAIVGGAVSPVVATEPATWPTPDWFLSPGWCKPALALVHAWSFGASMMVFLAGLRRVPRSLLEAASLDGAGAFGRFRAAQWPAVAPLVAIVVVLEWAVATQVFTGPYLLEHRGQDEGLLTFGLHFYRVAFESPHRFGYASAMAWLFTGIVFPPLTIAWFTHRRSEGAIEEP